MERILGATDYSRPSELLFDCIPEFQELGTKEVVLVHVIDYRTGSGSAISLKEHHENKLNDIKRKLEELGLRVKVVVALGAPAAEIVEIARNENVSLIVMGSHGAGTIKSILLGSTTINTVRLTDVPILIEKYRNVESSECEPACGLKFDRMVVPIDFSKKSLAVIDYLRTIKEPHGTVTLVSVIESSWSENDLDEKRKQVQHKLSDIEEELQNLGFDVKSEVRVGTASREHS